MNKNQFWILNGLAILATLLMVTRLLLADNNRMLNEQAGRVQAELAAGQNAGGMLQRLAGRINQAAQTEPELKDLLRQHHINIQQGGN